MTTSSLFCLLGNIDSLVNKKGTRGNTLMRKEVTSLLALGGGVLPSQKTLFY